MCEWLNGKETVVPWHPSFGYAETFRDFGTLGDGGAVCLYGIHLQRQSLVAFGGGALAVYYN